MTPQEIRYRLHTQIIGQEIEVYDQLQSTNDLALQRGIEGATEGTLILAEHQTAGRGRYGRTWHSPPGSSLLASLILRHGLLPDQIGLPNLMGAVSIATAIRDVTALPAMIKWPNDVLISGKKVSGVLTELEYDQNQRPFFVVGFGVNVNIAPTEFPFSLRSLATSLQIESGGEISRVALLCAILHRSEENYLHLKCGKTPVIINTATELLATIGEWVQLETPDTVFDGIAERIDAEGRLILREQSGRLRTFLNGEVVHTRR